MSGNFGRLEERIGRLEALEEIRQLKHVYQDGVDTRWNTEKPSDVTDFVGRVFTDDVVFIAPTDDEGTMTRVEGHSAMVDFLTEHHRRSVFSIHIVGNDIIELNGDEAWGQWSVLVPGAGSDGSLWYAARYVETYRRTALGWRIASSEQFVALNTPTSPWRFMPARGSLR
jgi:hypothetical protein